MDLATLLGLTKNSEEVIALNTVGSLLRWYEILTLGGVVFAITEFMERSRLRIYIFRLSNLAKDVFELIILSIFLVVVANLLPLLNRGSYTIALIHYPAFWELLSLIAFTVALILIIIFSIFPYRFIPKLTRNNCYRFFINIRNAILNDHIPESLDAIATILDRNIEIIFKYAAKYDRHWNIQGSHFKTPYEMNKVPKKDQHLVDTSRQLIDIAMSDKFFCHYLSENNIGLLLHVIDKINEYKLWNSCGYVFFDSLCKELFLNEQSHLSREMEFRGVGVHKPIFKALFTSFEILDWYRPFQSFSWWEDKNFKVDIINKYITGLNVAFEEYFKKERYTCLSGTPNIALSVALKNLVQILNFICIRIRKIKDDEIYYNGYHDVIMAIQNFFGMGNLEQYLVGSENYEPRFSREDLKVKKHSLTEGIVKSIFDFLDALTILENDDYARTISAAVFWLIFPTDRETPEIIKNMEDKLLCLLQERVEENKKGGYSSMIKLLINIYGFQFYKGLEDHIRIGKYIETEFKDNLAKEIIRDINKETRYLPRNYIVDREQKIIKDLHGKEIYREV